MYEYIYGTLAELNPAEAILEAGGIGYKILISLGTFSEIEHKTGEKDTAGPEPCRSLPINTRYGIIL